jgi:phosphate transport system substrate-binding protein
VTFKYPIARYLYVYAHRPKGSTLPPLVHEFFTFVLSKQGQVLVEKDGYFPMTDKQLKNFRSLL